MAKKMVGATADLRLFIAVELPQPVIDELFRIQSYLKKRNLFEGTYTHSGGMHITLKFLGDTTQEQLAQVMHALSALAMPVIGESSREPVLEQCPELPACVHESTQGHAPMVLPCRISGLDMFTAGQEIRILFLNMHCPELAALVHKLDTALAQWYKAETRPFVAHVTLARIKRVSDREKLLVALQEFAVNKIDFTIDRFVLKKSELTSEGPIYTDVATYFLRDIVGKK